MPPVERDAAELPVHLTGFVGRDREIAELVGALARARLLTLTGAGGSGKTRLAREVAARAAATVDRVAWVDLAPIADGGLIAQAIAAALRIADGGGDGLDDVVGAVRADSVLLVLDNCEHLVDACARVAELLLCACPRLTILATSREALGVPSETAWLVPPLADTEAVGLFVERAQAALPSFALTAATAPRVAEICRRLDGLPLAIELAAARVRVLSPAQIAERLDDAFRLLTSGGRTALPRHRTLRATMEWSFALLGDREQALLRRLAAFAATFTLDAAEAICAGDPLEPEDILDGVAALVDKSLVVMNTDAGVARYRLLETVRQYAVERLADAGEAEAMERAHTRYYLDMAASLHPRIIGGTAGAGAMARLGADQDELRAAMAVTLRHAEHDPARAADALRLADHLFWFWYGAGHWLKTQQFAEARRFTTEALRVARGADPLLRARAHMAAGLAAHPQGRFDEAYEHFDASLALAAAHGDPDLAIMARAKRAAATLMLGDVETAWRELDATWSEVQGTPPAVLYGFVAVWRTLAALERGELATARECMLLMERIGREIDNAVTVAHANALLGRVAVLGGELDEASARLQVALQAHLDLGDWWGLSLDLEWLSALMAERGRHADAARFAGAVDALRERVGIVLYPVDRPHRERRVARGRTRIGDEYDRHHAEGRTLCGDALTRLAADESVHLTAEHRVPTASSRAACATRCASRCLCVRALGPLQVLVRDEPIAPAAWGSARPRELLVYLLVYPDGRTKDQTGLDFWPDASPAQLRNNFHVTLHRLRRALGNADWIALAGDRYRVDAEALDGFDVRDFERDVAAARRAVQRQHPDAVELLERALLAYRGDFLEGEPAGDWHLEHRERLQRLHADTLMELGNQLTLAGAHARAADAYRRVLARDELHEAAVRALMGCHAAGGERTQALRAYQRFASRLRDELDAEPHAETARLAARLQDGVGG